MYSERLRDDLREDNRTHCQHGDDRNNRGVAVNLDRLLTGKDRTHDVDRIGEYDDHNYRLRDTSFDNL